MEYRRLTVCDKDKIQKRVYMLIDAYKSGKLGGDKMPEHENPGLSKSSKENYMYFTLPMALNYQRNSYTLWECANKMYREQPDMFDCKAVFYMDGERLKNTLVSYKVAMQPNKQPVIWKTLCDTIYQRFGGDIRNFFREMGYEVSAIKEYISKNKKAFPYLGGSKICNYWLYVMEQYTDVKFADRGNITVAPDTHVIQASVRLGVITEEEAQKADVQKITTERWHEILDGTEYVPIDVHTPLWLWSRGRFTADI